MLSICEIDHMVKTGEAKCRLHGEACPLWSRFDMHADENPYVQIARLSGHRGLVVNNVRRLRVEQETAGIERKFIFLFRDPRAIVASSLRKYPHQSTWRATMHWRRAIRKRDRFIRKQPADAVMHVHYESLNQDIEAGLQRLCAFLDLPFEPAMLEFWKADHHPIGGNVGPLLAVADHQKLNLDVPSRHRGRTVRQVDWSHYRKSDPGSFRDERWKQELSPAQQRLIGLMTDRISRRYRAGA